MGNIFGKLPKTTSLLLIFTSITVMLWNLSLSQTRVQARGTPLTETSRVFLGGIGPIRVGMTVAEASKVAGIKLIKEKSGGEPTCSYVKPRQGVVGLWFMVTEGRISRVDINNPRITTISGAKIGDSESRIQSLYPRQIQVVPHKYSPGGKYLIFVPKDRKDRNYRLIFETDGKKVTKWRVGKLPEVEWVEGCL